MIPKIIHYCWFGKGEKNKLLVECIESWKKYDFEIIEWNEENYDINKNFYLKENYENKNYAFVSDYVRLDILNKYGGVYLDTDQKITKEFPEEFFQNDAVFTFLFDCLISGGMIACKKESNIISELLRIYDSLKELKNLNNELITNYFLNNLKFKLNGKTQKIIFKGENIKIYSKNFFSIPSFWLVKNNYSIHYFENSWKAKKSKKLKNIFKNLIGEKIYYNLLAYKAKKVSPYYDIYKKQNSK